MQLIPIHAGYFKLDGGAMYGVVPKKIWQKINPPDDNNLCTWSMRCLLVAEGRRRILIDCGMGNKQDAKFFSHYEPSGPTLLDSLAEAGYTAGDITDVFLTHLHFDHCGGAVYRDVDDKLKLTFANATHWCNEKQWQWAIHPNTREKASFLKENILPIEESGHLRFVNEGEDLLPGFATRWVYGHTEAMMLPVLDYRHTKIVYCADLLPSGGHIPLPYVMGYDMRPLITLAEKESLLDEAINHNWLLFFEHDKDHETATVQKTDRGYAVKEYVHLRSL